jgi:hypothetical protein
MKKFFIPVAAVFLRKVNLNMMFLKFQNEKKRDSWGGTGICQSKDRQYSRKI